MSIAVKRLIRVVCFFLLFTLLLMPLTYVMRDSLITTSMTAINSIRHYPMDVVFCGGSAIQRAYWAAEAWNLSGLTSVVAWYPDQSRVLFADWVRQTREAVKGADGKEPFYVIDLLAFIRDFIDFTERALRRGLDSRPYTLSRLRDIWTLDSERLPVNKLELTFDIIKYHNNYENLTDPAMWERALFSRSKPTTGEYLRTVYRDVSFEVHPESTERLPLYPGCDEWLREVLTYCRDNGLRVWFVIPPLVETPEIRGMVNTIADTVREYGYEFTFLNDYLNEIGIDQHLDFSDTVHLNEFGAEKNTAWLVKELPKHVQWTDKRSDPAYAEWNRIGSEFVTFKAEKQAELAIIREAAWEEETE